jgi:replicative DNA helicase
VAEIQALRPGDVDALFSPEIEQQVIGAILMDNKCLMLAPELMPAHFAEPVHKRIMESILARAAQAEIASPLTIKLDLAGDKGFLELGGGGYLVRMAASANTHAFTALVAEVRALWAKREVRRALTEGVEAISRPDAGSATDVAAKVEADLGAIQMAAAKRPLSVTMQAAMVQSLGKIAEAYNNDTGLAGISTGLRALDDVIGGLAPGRCYVLAGRPAMGKSSVALNVAVKVALRGEGCWFGSLEMPAAELSNRFFSQMMAARGVRVPYSDIERGRMEEHEFRALIQVAKDFEGLPLDIGDPNTRTFAKVRSAVKRSQDRMAGKMRLVVIDYLQKLIPPGDLRELERISAAAAFTKNLALELELPVLALAQLSRGVEARDNRRPILSDLRGSGEIEQEADTVIFAYRDAYYLENMMKGERDAVRRVDMFDQFERTRNDLELIVAKQRGGRTGTALQTCDLAFNVIGDKEEELPFDR